MERKDLKDCFTTGNPMGEEVNIADLLLSIITSLGNIRDEIRKLNDRR